MNAPAVHIPKPKLWFTSDLHHGHYAAMAHNRRPWRRLDEMSEDLVEEWNKHVKKGDRGFVIGDFSFFGPEDTTAILSFMNGSKTLIKGNHDHTKTNVRVHGWDRVLAYHEERFMRKGAEMRLCLSHFPILGWHQQHDAAIHLHGHCHGNLNLPEELKDSFIFDVGVDHVARLTGDYRPIELEEILDFLKNRRSVSLDHHKIKRHHFDDPTVY